MLSLLYIGIASIIAMYASTLIKKRKKDRLA
jgi:hypothetical protein